MRARWKNPRLLSAALLALIGSEACALSVSREDCLRQFEQGLPGDSIAKRIEFMRGGFDMCRNHVQVSQDDCRQAYEEIVGSLERVRDKLEAACARAVQRTNQSCQGAADCQKKLSELVKGAREDFDPVRRELADMAPRMQALREIIVEKLREYARQQDQRRRSASTTQAPLSPRVDPVFQSALNPGTNPEALRSQINGIWGKSDERVVNGLWGAANALEMEQFAKKQQSKLGNTITGLGRLEDTAKNRRDDLRSVRNGPSDIVSRASGAVPLPAIPRPAASAAAGNTDGDQAAVAQPPEKIVSAPPLTPGSSPFQDERAPLPELGEMTRLSQEGDLSARGPAATEDAPGESSFRADLSGGSRRPPSPGADAREPPARAGNRAGDGTGKALPFSVSDWKPEPGSASSSAGQTGGAELPSAGGMLPLLEGAEKNSRGPETAELSAETLSRLEGISDLASPVAEIQAADGQSLFLRVRSRHASCLKRGQLSPARR